MRLLFVSDLHLGSGRIPPIYVGGWDLPALLDDVAGPDTHVVVNGDAIDFLLNDDPLRLDPNLAEAEAAAVAEHPPSRAVLQALGRVLAAGGQVTVRLGNHDVELALPGVQELLRRSMDQPAAIADRLVFERGEKPGQVEVGGMRVLYTHGEHTDPWNRVDYHQLGSDAFRHPPGSELVKEIINPLKARGLHFVDLLKPDFHGAVLSALAVDPGALRELKPGMAVRLASRVFRRKKEPLDFAETDELLDPLGARLGEAELTEDEVALLATLIDGGPLAFSDAEGEGRALRKLLRAGLSLYASAHRAVTGKKGERHFQLQPTDLEWNEARRLATRDEADVVVFGHTHAARFRKDEGLVYANTGTWIGLMQLPDPDAPARAWTDFLDLLRQNPELDPSRPGVPVLRRLTAVEVAEAEGGASVSLFAWKDGTREVLEQATLPGRR